MPFSNASGFSAMISNTSNRGPLLESLPCPLGSVVVVIVEDLDRLFGLSRLGREYAYEIT